MHRDDQGVLIYPLPNSHCDWASFLFISTTRTLLGMFLFANWVFRGLKCEAVIFLSNSSTCMHTGQLNYLQHTRIT